MEIMKRMCPEWMVLGKLEHKGNVVNYLDMIIWWDGVEKKWFSKRYDYK